MRKKLISLVLFLALFYSEEIFSGSKMDSSCSNPGFFIELSILYNQISGDFDGKSWLKRKSIEFQLPDVGEGIGLRLALGYSGSLTKKYEYSVDLNFARSSHHADWENNESDVILVKFGLDSKFYYRKNKRLQPFFELGLLLTRLYLKPHTSFLTESSADSIAQSKIVFTGVGGKSGAGVAYQLNHNLSITAKLNYEIRSYYHVKFSRAWTPFYRGDSFGDRISGNGLMANIGVRYSF